MKPLHYTVDEEGLLEFNIYHLYHSPSYKTLARRARALPPLLLIAVSLSCVFLLASRLPLWGMVLYYGILPGLALWYCWTYSQRTRKQIIKRLIQ